MDPLKLFSARSFSSPEKVPVVEDSNFSLQSSLSSDCAIDEKGKQKVYSDNSNLERVVVEKMKSNSVYLESTHVSLELELSLSGSCIRKDEEKKETRFLEIGECSYKYQSKEEKETRDQIGGLSLELSLGFNYAASSCSPSKKRPAESDRRVSSSCRSKKRTKVAREEEIMTELRLGHDPWCIKKKLCVSDVNNNSRLLLSSETVQSHVFPYWNAEQKAQIEQGLLVAVWDCDTKSQHKLVFKQWNNGGANVFIKYWVSDFVKRRELKIGDEIGLYWDEGTSKLKFAVLKRYAGH